MNTSPSTPNLELLRKAIQEYQPDPSRIPFSNLKPFHDSIMKLRGKNASYAAIADLLMRNGIKTSRARVAEYGRIVLEGGKRRKRRKRAKSTPAVSIPAAPQSAPDVAKKTVPTAAPTVTSNASVPQPSHRIFEKSAGTICLALPHGRDE
jgi:predicted sugar kinase